MSDERPRFIGRVFVAMFLVAFASDARDSDSIREKITINVHQSDHAIRNELLKYTPLGSSADSVIDFVLSRIYFEGLYSSTVGIIAEPALGGELGHRYDNPPWGHSAVDASWMFDKNLKLRDIEIQSVPQEGLYSHSQDPDLRPKVKINLHQSDEAIRREILKETPVGSDRVLVEVFIGSHLYFQGGSLNGALLGGKAGSNGIILGHYYDERVSKERSIWVFWNFDANDRLQNIEVQRTNFSRSSS